MLGLLQDIRDGISKEDHNARRHAQRRMALRQIDMDDVVYAVLDRRAEIIERYPDDSRSPSCLVLGFTSAGRPLHMQFSYPPRPWLVTVYEPVEERWDNLRTRRPRDE